MINCMCPETAFSLTPDSIQVCPISLQAWKSQETEFNISTIISSQVFPIKTLLERLDQELLAWENVFICLQILVGMIQCHKTLFNLWSTALIKVNFFKKSWVQNNLHKHPLSSMPYLNIMQLYYIEHNHYQYLHLWLPNKGAHHNFSSNTYSIYCHSCFKIIYTTQD